MPDPAEQPPSLIPGWSRDDPKAWADGVERMLVVLTAAAVLALADPLGDLAQRLFG